MDSSTTATADHQLLDSLESGDFQTALQLLPKDGPLITIGPEGLTPLHYACRHGETEVARLLVTQYKYSIQSSSKGGQTPAHSAAKYGHIDALRVLVKDVGTPNVTTTSISDISCLQDKDGNTPLHTAAAYGQLTVAQYLIREHQCNPTCANLKAETPLHLAAENGHLEVVKYLVDDVSCATSPLDEKGRTPVYKAAGHGQIEVVKYLIEIQSCDANVRTTKRWETSRFNFAPGRTPLHTASREGRLNVVHYLVNELKCDPSCRDEDGVTPLYLASQEGHLAIVKFLVIECQCDPAVTRDNGVSPLHGASMKGHLNTVKYLINEHQVDPSCQDEDGDTPLHLASQNRHLAVVQFLIGKGCDPLARDNDNYSDTPVHEAALNGRLIDPGFSLTVNGCHPMVRGQCYRTPLHFASEEGDLDTVKYLINEHQVYPSCPDENYSTPITLAAQNGHLAVVQFLVEKGCDPLAITQTGQTSLNYAALGGKLNVLEFFITEKGCDPMVTGWKSRTPLHSASDKGHLDTVKYLINEHQVDLSCQDDDGIAPLHLASFYGHLAVVQFLFEKGCDPLARNKFGDTPVHSAALNGRLNILEFFITEKGCDPRIRGWNGRDPLHIASVKGHLDTVKYLINEHQVDPSCQDEDGTTPLHQASQNGRLSVVQFLTEKGCDPLGRNKFGGTPVHAAAWNGRLNVLEFFFTEKGCDPMVRDSEGMTLLHHASQNGHLDTAKYLINEHQVDPSCQDDHGFSPLHLASQNGHLAVVQFLTEKGCDPLARTKTGYSSLRHAALGGRLNVLEFFIADKGCVPIVGGQWGRTLLHCASQEGHLETVKYLINEHDVDPSCQDEDGTTPLHLASMKGHLAVVQFLIVKGCDPLARNKSDNTSLQLAALKGRLNILEFFITKKGCDPMIKGQWGSTLLHFASQEGHIDTVKYLINELQTAPSCQDENCTTPLHVASQFGHLAVVHFLIEKGCDPLARNKLGNTPVHWAALNGRLNILKFFITEKGCVSMVRGWIGRTPLHFASEKGYLDTVKYLINEHQVVDLSCQDENGTTPLHLASQFGRLAVVQFLVEKGCEPLARNKFHSTPVHSAALNGRLNVLEFFITKKGCDPMVKGWNGRTPLHDASDKGHIDTVKYLISEHQVDPSCQDEDGSSPLHLASQFGHLAVVQFLTEKGCDPLARTKAGSTSLNYFTLSGRLNVFDPMVRGQWGRTPLHYASQAGHLDTVKYLINKRQIDPSCQDESSTTPLHLASMNGHLTVIKFLIEEAFCDPSERTASGSTPMSLACANWHDDVALFLYSKGEQLPWGYTMSRPTVDCRVKVYFVGNHSIGKSTLVKALSAENAWFGNLRNVSGVTLQTTGVVPHEFKSGLYGKVTFYDFAGHKEYYASHEVVFENSSRPLILITVNVSEDDNSICKALRFWKQFLASAVSASGCQARVIIVGSHADLVSPQVRSKKAILQENFEPSPSLAVVDSVLLDCRKSSSAGMTKLRMLLKKNCQVIRLQAQFDYQKGGILNAFIVDHLSGVPALTFTDLLSYIRNRENSDYELFKAPDILYQTCESLNISGHLLLLKSEKFLVASWIVLNKDVILSQVHGLLEHLKQFTQLGIVPLSLLESLLQQHAQDLHPDLAIRYMKKMLFCSEIDPQALTLIKNYPPESMYKNERYFLFSNLISVERPSQVWEWTSEHALTYPSGWYLNCSNPDHFFTPRFHQVLLIELACQFALKVNPSSPVSVESRQGCYIWKNGIRWLDPCGTEVMVQVEEDGKSLSLMLRCLEESKLLCTFLRSTLIWHILAVKGRVCKETETKEYFIHPKYLQSTSPPKYALIPLSEVVTPLLQRGHRIVVNEILATSHGSPFLSTEDLLYFEPYEGIDEDHLQSLFNPENHSKVIELSILEEFAEVLHMSWKHIGITLHTRQVVLAELTKNDRISDVKKCNEILTRWSAGKGTYSDLRRDLEQYSIFRGRNPLDLADIPPAQPAQQQPSLSLADNLQPAGGLEHLLEGVDDICLGIESLLEVRTEVVSVMAHSTDLGLALGLTQEPTLHTIQRDNQQDTARQFTEVIAAWLRGVDRVATPSWRSLTKALLSPNVNYPEIARKLAENHPSGSSSGSTGRPTSASSEPVLQFQDVDALPLDGGSLSILLRTLVDRSHLWFHVGLVLGLNYGRLRIIQSDTVSTEECLVKALSSWLSLRDRVQSCGQPCWRSLARALAHPLVGELRLAEEIAERHKAAEVHVEDSDVTAAPVMHNSDPSTSSLSVSPPKST